MDTDSLRTLIKDRLGINALLPGAEEVLDDLVEGIFNNVLAAVLERLPEAKRGELEEAIGSGDNGRVLAFIAREVPDLEHIVRDETARAMEDFKKFRQDVA